MTRLAPDRLTATILLAAAVFAAAIVGVVTLALVVQHGTNARIDRNTRQIDHVAYKLCAGLNAGFRRSNSVIDAAIAKEEAKAHPSKATLDALRKFKQPIPDCGPRR